MKLDNLYSATLSFHRQTLDFIRHWLNSIALHALGAPVLLVGTHKDKLKNLFGIGTEKSRQKKLLKTQEILTGFLNTLFVAKKTRIIECIKRPSGDGGEWFFAVDNKSRTSKRKGDVKCKDPSIDDFRKTLEQIILDDKRTVPGVCTKGTEPMPTASASPVMHLLCCSCLSVVEPCFFFVQVWMASRHLTSIFRCQ